MLLTMRHLLVVLALGAFVSPAFAGTLTLISTSPARLSATAARTAAVTLEFNLPVDRTSVGFGTVRVYGRWSGAKRGTFAYSNGDRTLTLNPDRPFSAGETVFVNLSEELRAADGSPFRAGGWALQFAIATGTSDFLFHTTDVLSVRNPPAPNPRIYGGVASDHDLDGWLDLTLVNEDTGDLRVLMNRADGTGLYHPYLDPPAPVQLGASPNEPADFDNDGFADLATANVADASVSIVLGNGDGTFGPQQRVAVGSVPKGLAVLDVDGDADLDLAVAHLSGNNLAVLINNGAGVFGAPTFFEGGGNGEHGLVAGDFDNDGLFDLAVGTLNGQQVILHLGNGDGTFDAQPATNAGGTVWMMVAGDLNGDGNLDVTTANSSSNTGSVLFGNGATGFGAPVTHAAGGFSTATDVGDLDGDGDPDWVLSSFGGGLWRVFENTGGVFTRLYDFPAVSNPGCAVLLDFDNDTRLDLALLDEIADLVTLKRNDGPTAIFADGFESGTTAAWGVVP
jgi:FG-GAP-like repeat/Bacterial Ig-like domain